MSQETEGKGDVCVFSLHASRRLLSLLSSFCGPPQSYAALGQQFQVLERP